jgi:arthrofactin-type cyclic lipopeptide synthetase C
VGETETTLAGIWAEVLKVERVGRHDNFFALGGHSLLAVQVIMRLQQALGVEVSPLDLFSCPTVQSLAEKIGADQNQPVTDNAICIRKGTLELPLFMPHEASGDLLHIQALAQYIDSSIPIYGLPEKYIDGGLATARTIEGMATRMVRMIRAVQPHGPYRVAGWSLGGTLAYEIAVQLIGADQDVEFVGLLDTFYLTTEDIDAIEPYSSLVDDKQNLLRLIRRSIGNEPSFDGNLGKAIDDIEARMMTLSFEDTICKCREVLPFLKFLFDGTAAQVQRRVARIHVYTLAVRQYYARPIPKSIHLFVAKDNPPATPPLGWEAVLPESQIRRMPVPGTHLLMMQPPNIEVLGRTLSSAISARIDCQEIAERRYSPLVTLQHGTDSFTPLFCVPGAGASVTSFHEVVSCLEERVPVFGLQPRGLDSANDLLPHSTVAAAAEAYIRAIRATCPKGPLHLLGHSFGGWVVLEMAHLLAQSTYQIASVIILDSEVPDSSDLLIRDYWSHEVIMAWVEAVEQVLGQALGIELKDLERLNEVGQRELLHKRLVKRGGVPRRSHPDILRGPLRTFGMSLRSQFRPGVPYKGELHLVLPDDAELGFGSRGRKQSAEATIQMWRKWAPELIYHHAPGSHMTMLKMPHASFLASLIRDCLTAHVR